MKTNRKLLNIAIIITFSSIIGKILGFIRDILISNYYGSSSISDGFFFSLSLPILVLGIFTSSTDSAIIPMYNSIKVRKSAHIADQWFIKITTIISIIGVMSSFLILINPIFFIKIFSPGFNNEQIAYATKYLKYFSFTGLFHILYCFFCSYNAIFFRNEARSILSFSTNLIVVVTLLIKPDANMHYITIAYLIGSALSGFIPIMLSRKVGLKNYNIKKPIFDTDVTAFWKFFFPIMGVAAITNLNSFVDKFIASKMAVGSITYIVYANKIPSIFDSIFIIGISSVLLPFLSKTFIENDLNKFKEISDKSILLLYTMLFPLFMIIFFKSEVIVKIVFLRGAFKYEDAKYVSGLLQYYSPMIIFVPIQTIFFKIFHSTNDTKTPLNVNIISITFNIILSIILSKLVGINGLAIATSISLIISCIILSLILSKRNKLGLKFGNRKLHKLFVFSILSFIVANSMKQLFGEGVLGLLVYGILNIMINILIATIFYKKDLIEVFRK